MLLAASALTAEEPTPALRIDPLNPPLGLKTYRDLGLIVDETMIARAWRPDVTKGAPLQKALQKGAWLFPMYDKANRIQFTVENNSMLWSSYSKDHGKTWSEPRFIAALAGGHGAIKRLEFRRASGRAFIIVLDNASQQPCEIRFRENDLRRLATAEDLRRAPPGRFVLNSVSPDNRNPDLLADSLCLSGDLAFSTGAPPRGYRIEPDVGLLMHESIKGSIIHRAQSKAGTLFETRVTVTPGGDYIAMIPDGQHASAPREQVNRLLGYRSSNHGATWNGPFSVFGDVEKHHGTLPLVPRGEKRIYLFETHRGAPAQSVKRDRVFGFRYSDDDGHTWSAPELIRVNNNKTYFTGLGVIHMTETTAGTWMAGFHHSRMVRGAKTSDGQRRWTDVRQAVESESQSLYTLDELRVLGLVGASVMAMSRTCEGHLWEMRSADDGTTWTVGKPTALVHPDAPPMLFHLSDRRTLIALHHNRAVLRSVHESVHSEWLTMPTPTAEQVARGDQSRHSLQDWVSRAEVWFSLSKDEGQTWSEPRLLFANALAETLADSNPNYQCSYIDLFIDRGTVHLIVPHRWQRVVHLTFPEDQLDAFLTRDQIKQRLSPSP